MRAIAVHGGAGAEAAAARELRRAGVVRATELGWAALTRGGSALDAVIEAVAVLEDDPHFNAGRGAVLSEEGTVELDASLMAGDTLAAGAVGAVSGVPNPIHLARAVLVEGREVLLVGEPAREAARRHAIPLCPPEALVTDEARRRREQPAPARLGAGDTVGAVAADGRGHVAAATSTGGIAGKRRGRVGDSAVIGAGTYADDALGAGSATGPGEAIIRFGVVWRALVHLGRGFDPAWVAQQVLADMVARLGAEAGLVLIDPTGRVGIAHTSPAMAAAYRTDAAERTFCVG